MVIETVAASAFFSLVIGITLYCSYLIWKTANEIEELTHLRRELEDEMAKQRWWERRWD